MSFSTQTSWDLGPHSATINSGTIHTNIYNNYFSATLLVDFPKTFDIIDHNLLNRRLKLFKLIIGNTSFLVNQTQSLCFVDIHLPLSFDIMPCLLLLIFLVIS